MKRIITFGTFDVFHVGHLSILERAAALGDYLVVGISTDELNLRKKNKRPVYSFADRKRIVESIRCVNQVFAEDSLEEKRDYIRQYGADILVMGDDWDGKFDFCEDLCEVVYLPRTPAISSTHIIETIKTGVAIP